MWKSFSKLKILRVIAYLLKYKFDLNESWIFLAIYKTQKLNAKTCFSKTSKGETCFLKINYLKIKYVINEEINWKLRMWKTS